MIRNDIDNLFRDAEKNKDIFEFLTGQGKYEIRTEYVYMPTDTDIATFLIKKHLLKEQNFDINLIINEMIKISNDEKWSWLIIYYIGSFKNNQLDFLPTQKLYENLKTTKNSLKNNDGWLCYNFKPELNNLWDIIVVENQRLKEKYDLPELY